MRKLLVTSLIALLTVAASAQSNTNTRTGSQTSTPSTKTSLTPSSTARQGTSTTKTTAQPSGAKTQQPATTARSENNANTTSQTKTVAPTTGNPSSANQNTGTTARGVATVPVAATTTTAKKTSEAKVVNPVKVKWLTLEEALEKSKTDKRKIFVDVYTDWCGWCKRMDSTTFLSPAVVQYLNDHYYPVKFNAEQQKDIVFKDKTYQFKKNGTSGYHELAAQWLNNRLTYPTVVFLDENQGPKHPFAG
jgi:thioredoxin-related protein